MSQLYIVSTPIGNLEDITLRAIKILFTVPIIVAEDTRRTGNLLEVLRRQPDLLKQVLGPNFTSHKPQFLSFFDQVEAKKVPQIIEILKRGQDVALVSDAGTPLISDPGFKLVRAAITAGIRVTPIPGPSALTAALVGSGMPPGKIFYLGYLPPRQRRRRKELTQLQTSLQSLRNPPTIVVYEAPHRLQGFLQDVLEISGNIEMVIAQELTKIHEKFEKRSVSLWLAEYEQHPQRFKGEYTILFQFPSSAPSSSESEEADDDDS